MKDRVAPICVIAPTEAVAKKSELIIAKYHKNVDVYQASLVNAAELAKELVGRGAEIFISRRGTKSCIEKVFPEKVVEIDQVLADYIPILEAAVKEKGIIAFFRYGLVPEDVRTMCLLLKIEARYYSFSNLEECEQIVQEAIKDKAVLGVGGADSASFSEKYGLKHMVVESSESSLLRALTTAEQLLRVSREEQEKQQRLRVLLERYEMVFNYTHDAIMAVDENGKIVVLNDEAEKIIKHVTKPYVGKNIEDILPNTHMKEVLATGKKELNQLMNINGTMVSTNRIPIVVDGEVMGAVATFQDVKSLQDSEQKIRLKLHEKGLVARYHFDDIIGVSSKMKDNISLAEKFARSDATVLLQGETGTGKELFAQSIHNASERAQGPFVAVNCGALPKNLLEAELFGYEEGAFTGASKGGKRGIFEMAHGGTVFLDEIGEMPLETQVQLLRVLQEKEIRRLGSDRVIPVNIRVITATHRNLKQCIKEGTFREDLFYRLNVLNIAIPPLRERSEDVPLIGMSIFGKYTGKMKSETKTFVNDLLCKLKDYEWPGNVRELHNLIERIVVLVSQGESFEFVEDYICSYLQFSISGKKERGSKAELEAWERERIVQALKENNLEIIRTAEALGISRGTLWRKMKKYDIQSR